MNQIYNLKVKEGGHIDKRTKSNDKQTNKLTTLTNKQTWGSQGKDCQDDKTMGKQHSTMPIFSLS